MERRLVALVAVLSIGFAEACGGSGWFLPSADVGEAKARFESSKDALTQAVDVPIMPDERPTWAYEPDAYPSWTEATARPLFPGVDADPVPVDTASVTILPGVSAPEDPVVYPASTLVEEALAAHNKYR